MSNGMKTQHVVAFAVATVAASVALSTPALARDQVTEANQALAVFLRTDPGLRRFLDTSAGYAVFPSVVKGAVAVGGARGEGVLFRRGGVAIAKTTLTQVTVGLALGGQSYTEVIFFENQKALDDFKAGNFALAAQVSAVALAEGASRTAKYQNGVAVFTATNTGLMFEASVGGQKFSVKPLK
jgi:lipid-binding SYLF domain-containing protein